MENVPVFLHPSDPARETRGLQPEREGRVRCSAWLGRRSLKSGVILSAVERLVKRHVVAGLNLNPPPVVLVLRWACYQAEDGAKSLNLEWLNLNAAILNLAKLCESLLDCAGALALLKLCSRAQVVDASLTKSSLRVEEVKRNKLATGTAANRVNKWCGEEKLTAIRCAPDMTGVVIIVVDCDKVWFAHGVRRRTNGLALASDLIAATLPS
jgi:hypothetical protein